MAKIISSITNISENHLRVFTAVTFEDFILRICIAKEPIYYIDQVYPVGIKIQVTKLNILNWVKGSALFEVDPTQGVRAALQTNVNLLGNVLKLENVNVRLELWNVCCNI